MAGPERALRILLVFRTPVGGLFRHVHDLAGGLIARGHAVGILCDSGTGGERADRMLGELAPRLALGLHRMPMARLPHPNDFAVLARVARLTRALRPDILHGHGAKGGLHARFAGVFAPGSGPLRCYTPHGGSLHYKPGSLAHRPYMLMERWLERGTDLFLFESQFVQERYDEYVKRSTRPARVALNGLHPHEFAPVSAQADACDFLYIGEFRALKGVDILIEAMRLLAARGLRPSVQMVGYGPSEAEFRALARQAGLESAFAWRGATPASEAFRLGRIMVMPSRAESLPYIVLEAAAARLPMIATRVGGIPEILPADDPWLIAPENPAALAEAMAEALAQPGAALAEKAARLAADVEARFSIERMVDGVIEGYRHALAERRPGAGWPG